MPQVGLLEVQTSIQLQKAQKKYTYHSYASANSTCFALAEARSRYASGHPISHISVPEFWSIKLLSNWRRWYVASSVCQAANLNFNCPSHLRDHCALEVDFDGEKLDLVQVVLLTYFFCSGFGRYALWHGPLNKRQAENELAAS